MSRSNQLDFINDFEAADRERDVAERQREVTHEIIDQSAADGTVKSLLHMLADFPRRTKDERGNWLITASIAKMESRLGRSRNTVRAYIRSACQTGFLEILDPSILHDERTYIIHWRSILDRELNETGPNKRSQDCPTEDDEKDSIPSSNKRDRDCSTEDGTTRSTPRTEGGQSLAERWSISRPEVVNLTTSGGQLTGVKTPQPPKETPEDVFKGAASKRLLQDSYGAQQGTERAQVAQRVPNASTKWEREVTGKNLSSTEQVHQLYEVACQLGILLASDMNRLNVFVQAAVNERLRLAGKAQTPNGIFRSNVYRQKWYQNNRDIDRGRIMMREADKYVRRSDQGEELERQKKLGLERAEVPPEIHAMPYHSTPMSIDDRSRMDELERRYVPVGKFGPENLLIRELLERAGMADRSVRFWKRFPDSRSSSWRHLDNRPELKFQMLAWIDAENVHSRDFQESTVR